MKAVVVPARGQIELKDVPVPEPGAGEVLVKRDFLAPPGSWLGCDFAGTVDKVGSGVTNVKVGDRVAAFVHGGQWEGEGWAEYIKAQSSLVWKVPDNLRTAIQALFFRLPLSTPWAPTKEPEPVLIWGGSTSVGLYAIQLLKLAGYTVVATSSEKNFETLKKFGATGTYSYSDPEVSAQIAKDYPKLRYALDTIAEGKTTVSAVKAISQAAGRGKVITLLTNKDEELKQYEEAVPAEMTLVYTVLGVPFDWPGVSFPAMPEDKSRMEDWCANHLPELFASGQLKPNPILSFKGGLENVNEGLEYLKAGKNSAQKVTYKI
ncbi:Zinc-binding oxidoreductase alcohol dehydrogenase [Rhodotorula kratochvilovae]